MALVSVVKASTYISLYFGGPIKMPLGKWRGIVAQKAHICKFICLPIRAFHLEVVYDMSTNARLEALCRFISRHDSCSDMFNDQERNFHGVNSQMLKFYQDTAFESGIRWHFNPPAAAHFGGSC